MDINAKGLSILKTAEGFYAEPYICPAGKLTVGYGHTGNVSGPVTQEQAEVLLKGDLKAAQDAVEAHVTVPLTENQFSALVSLVYNIGANAFANSTLLDHLNNNEIELAAAQFDRWIYANGHVLPGLVKRRQLEKELFLSNA